ncbi:MAG: acyl-CoA dehydrogenase family protein [Parvularculales bacterium]
MSLTLSEEQQLLKESAEKFFTKNSPVSRMRSLRDTRDAAGFSRDVWKQMANLGWLGIPFSTAHGGSDMGLSELGVVLFEAGRVLAPEPLLSTLLMGANAVHLSGNEALKTDVLPAVVAGDRLVAFAFEEKGRFDPYAIKTEAVSEGDSFLITGEKGYVLDGHVADQMVVLARMSGQTNDRDGLVLFLVNAEDDGISVQRTCMIDGRNVARVAFSKVEVSADSILGDTELLERVIEQATLGLVAEMVGMADETFERTLTYLKEREQFGVKIGTFQALRHRAAEMFAELEFARSLLLDGLSAIDEGRSDTALSVSAAKAQANKTARLIGAEGVQMHGGMGMTNELDIGLFLKRLKAAEFALGDETHHHRRFASLRGY